MHTLLLMRLSDFCDLLGFPTATVIWGALRNVHADKKYPVHQSVPRTSSLLVLFINFSPTLPPPPQKIITKCSFPRVIVVKHSLLLFVAFGLFTDVQGLQTITKYI